MGNDSEPFGSESNPEESDSDDVTSTSSVDDYENVENDMGVFDELEEAMDPLAGVDEMLASTVRFDELARAITLPTSILLSINTLNEKHFTSALSTGISVSPTPATTGSSSSPRSSSTTTYSISERNSSSDQLVSQSFQYDLPEPCVSRQELFELAFYLGRYVANAQSNLSDREKDFYAFIIAGFAVSGVTFYLAPLGFGGAMGAGAATGTATNMAFQQLEVEKNGLKRTIDELLSCANSSLLILDTFSNLLLMRRYFYSQRNGIHRVDDVLLGGGSESCCCPDRSLHR